MHRRHAFASIILSIAAHSSALAQVEIFAGDSIQQAVDMWPEGTAFILRPGIHRMQRVRPKNGNLFLGDGATMSGARVLSFAPEGRYWVASGQTQRGFAHGQCDPGFERCRNPEELFMDDVRLRHVTGLSAVGPGSWFLDYNTGRIYISDDPTGRTVETSVTTYAFHGAARDVTIRGLIIEKYANPAQHGAVHGKQDTMGESGGGWIVEGNIIRSNHGAAIAIGDGMQILGNRLLENGQIGISGEFQRVLRGVIVLDNEIAYNNTAGFHSGWEAGGTKFSNVDGLTVKSNHVHRNAGPGLWTDGSNIHTLYEGNLVEENGGIGIFHEISYDAVVRYNTVRHNGYGYDAWLWGAQILIAASSNVEVYSNDVTAGPNRGNGITLVQQNRGNGRYGPFLMTNVYVHHNVITYKGPAGKSGAGADLNGTPLFSGSNRFDHNIYRMTTPGDRWHWNRGFSNWSAFRSLGQELNGSLVESAFDEVQQ